FYFFFSSRRRHTRFSRDWSSDVCSSDLIAVALLAPVLAFYMLMDATKFKQRARELTPPQHREEVMYVGNQLATALGSFVRGQLLVAMIVGALSSIALYFLGLPFWLLVGLTAGLLNLV